MPLPYLQVTVDIGKTIYNLAGVGVWSYTDSQANVALSRNLSIYVHNTANFSTDPSTTLCASRVRAYSHWDTFVACPNVTDGVRYGEWGCSFSGSNAPHSL